MNPINKYDVPGIEDVLSRYERLSVNTNNGAGIFFRWQLMVGESLVDNSKLSNYLVNPNGNFNVDGDGKETINFNLKDVLHPENKTPGSYSLKLYTHATPKDLFTTRAVEFYIKTISNKKDEIVLGVHDNVSIGGTTSEANHARLVYQTELNTFRNKILPLNNLVLSLADGSIVHILANKNLSEGVYRDSEIAVKLANGVPKNIKPGQRAKIEIQITEPREWDIIIPQPPYVEELNIMALPDFTTNFSTAQGPLSSKYETWASLLGSNEDVKNKLLNATFSGSNATSAELGIDYRKYENFVHFSSAKERLDNFKYKIQLIEYYDSQSVALSASASPAAEVNRVQFVTKKNDIISKFDAYEDYLYTESSSYENGSYGIFNASTWPKTNSSIPYTLAHSTSSAFTEWYATQSATALDYDIDNAYNLEKTIPDHIRLDTENANYLMFVNMIGQHFDHVYNYVDHMDMIHDRQNELHLGLSKDLVWDVLKSLGWHGINGYNFEDLWAYKLGTDSSGGYQTTEASSSQIYVNETSMPTEDIAKEIWSRTLNNLPHLISTKGTERSVRALVNTYGLPPTVLRIKEYGGTPKEMSTSQYIKYENSGYSLKFDGSQRLDTPWGPLSSSNYNHFHGDKSPDVVEFRFNASEPQTSILVHNSLYWGIELQAHPSASNTSSSYHNHGRLWTGYYGGASGYEAQSTSYLPIFDNDWWNIQFGLKEDGMVFLDIKKSADHSNGRITHSGSIRMDMSGASYDAQLLWNEVVLPHQLGFGTRQNAFYNTAFDWVRAQDGTGSLPGYTGSLQEIRYWAFPAGTEILSDAAFDNHVLSPLSIEGNTYTSSYTDLVARWPLGSTGTTSSIESATISSEHPNQTITKYAFTSSLSSSLGIQSMDISGSDFSPHGDNWQYEEETFYTVVPEIIGTRAVSDKIRIADSTYSGSLHKDLSVVSSSTQLSAPDSPLLGVFFSPNDDIDLDISHQIGGAKFDDFVGNPRDAYRSTYKELRNIQNFYWKKYQASPTFAAYLKVLKYFDSSLFLQLESLLPARANKQTGLLIKPNLLERPTIVRASQSFANLTYESPVVNMIPSSSTYMAETITSDLKTYIVNGRDTHVNASQHLPNSFDDSLATAYGISNMASQDVPVYDRASVSRRVRIQGEDGTDQTVQAQDFIPAGIKNQRYAGSKYGIVQGSIGGIINLVNDPTVTGKGLFDSATNIKCSIEVTETNPVELTTTEGPMTGLGDIQIR